MQRWGSPAAARPSTSAPIRTCAGSPSTSSSTTCRSAPSATARRCRRSTGCCAGAPRRRSRRSPATWRTRARPSSTLRMSSTATWCRAAAGRTSRSGRAPSSTCSSARASRPEDPTRMTAPGQGAVPPSAASTAGVLSRGRIVDVTGRRVHVHDVGSGPPVMLLHGSGPGTTAAAWSSLAAAFAGAFRVIAPDFAGLGAREGGAYGRAAWTAQILGLADVLELERFAVVGNSMGGAIALSVAAARPGAVTKVVGIGTLGIDMPLPAGLDQLWSYEPGRENARALLELLHSDRAYVTDAAIEARLRATLEPEPRGAFAAMFPPPRARWVHDLALSDDELRAIVAPVLLVHGARDKVVPLESSTLMLLGRLRDVRAHVFGGVGHASPVERAAELARLLTTFLEDHD